MKMKEFGPRGGMRLCSPLDLSMYWNTSFPNGGLHVHHAELGTLISSHFVG